MESLLCMLERLLIGDHGSQRERLRINLKENRPLKRGIAMGDIAMARGVCAL